MKATIVGLVTPHVLSIVELASQAEAGVNVDWHVRTTVERTLDDLGAQFNARELLASYIHGLETAAQDTARAQTRRIAVLRQAAAMAARDPRARD